MKLYKQTILHSESTNGNCWATCLACLLDLDQIPELDILNENWWDLSEQIANTKNLTLFEFPWYGGRFQPRFCIVSGDSPRGNFKHSVIGKLHMNKEKAWVELLHDPHPDNTGILTEDYFEIIEKL